MKAFVLLLSVAVSATFLGSSSAHVVAASGPSDARILAAAAVQRGHAGPRLIAAHLRAQPRVSSAVVAPDDRTVDIRFRDGMHAAILSDRLGVVRPVQFARLLRPAAPAGAPGGARAAVWEPFASELGLGPNAGDIEVQQLGAAGFAVDQQYDTGVTVAQMTTLAAYNVVYMHTHSGVSASGDGVLASGEPANGDPAVAPYIADGSVITVGVSGSSQLYYGVTSRFISSHLGTFPTHSILFLNGCALLRATGFWQALQARGAGVMVSWDQNAAAKDDFLSAGAFFNLMGSGSTVSSAISGLRAAGYGTSSDQGIPATMGYLGDGSITLAQAAAGGSSPPTPTATPERTATPIPTTSPSFTPTPTRTPVPTSTLTTPPTTTATSTPVPTHPPVSALVSLARTVKPGAVQRIAVSNLVSGSSVQARVTFPDGESRLLHATANSGGRAALSFTQPGSVLTRYSRTAAVEITATTASGTATTTEHYTIGYGTVDVVANPRVVHPGRQGAVLVHTRPHTRVSVVLRLTAGKAQTLHGTTGKLGWVKLHYVVQGRLPRLASIHIRAGVRLNGHMYHASTTIALA